MKQETRETIHDNGSYTLKTVKTKTAEDGLVPESQMYTAKVAHNGKYHKGDMKVVSYRTNDPRVTRSFVCIICSIFILIGIGMMLVKGFAIFKMMGIIFAAMGIYALVKSLRDIKKIENQLARQNGEDHESE